MVLWRAGWSCSSFAFHIRKTTTRLNFHGAHHGFCWIYWLWVSWIIYRGFVGFHTNYEIQNPLSNIYGPTVHSQSHVIMILTSLNFIVPEYIPCIRLIKFADPNVFSKIIYRNLAGFSSITESVSELTISAQCSVLQSARSGIPLLTWFPVLSASIT